MSLRIGLWHCIAAAVLWTMISAVSGFAFSRYVIDAELRRTDATVRETAEDFDRYGLAMTEQVVNTTRAFNHKIEALVVGKGRRK
ncbi:MAG TPA: hypothetical protein VMF91_20450 [Bryobacteraceae bacterium]|nr:hypothetical protein [Bryobacteraceae bacterium]